MTHPEFLLVPALMLSDYALTVAGARLRDAGYSRHFRTPHYEMNPIWQNAIAKRRWFNPLHLVMVAVVTLLFFGVVALSTDPVDPLPHFILGVAIGTQGMINGRHLANLATFAYLKREPGAIEGAVTIGHVFALRLSMVQTFAVLVPLALMSAIDPEPLTLGATLGVAAMTLIHFVWISRFRARSAQLACAVAAEASPTASGTNLPPASSSANSSP